MRQPISGPLIPVDHGHVHTAFFFEALVTTLVITITLILDDFLTEMMEYRNMARWKKYLIHTVLIFIAVLVCIYTLSFLFGYGEALVPITGGKKRPSASRRRR